ncbi:MAG TPA: hypothetical protein VIH90_08595 [Candidatus Saccharimonadales bacterium]
MSSFIYRLKRKYPKINFSLSDNYYWSPETNEIFYKNNLETELGQWSLIHEVGHALLEHKSYDADFMLIRLEVEAWNKAKEISNDLGISINEDHIQDCLDTYRDWIFKRSICPNCTTKCFQQSDFSHYSCFNCHATWRVTPSRFCRTYRTKEAQNLRQKVFV